MKQPNQPRQPRHHKPRPPLFRTDEIEALLHGDRERWFDAMEPEMRHICTRLGTWRTCRLPRCRRGRICTGARKLNTFDPRFPPCIAGNADHARWLKELSLYEDELAEAYPGLFKEEDASR